MSYCVQCGVQLARDLERCPLCQTPVINPNLNLEEKAESEHPQLVEQALVHVDRGYAAQLSIIITLVPILVVLLLDILDKGKPWSPYVIGALVMVWCFLVLPLVIRLKRPYVYIAVDVLALCGYLALIAAMSGDFSWYLSIVLPLLLLIGVTALLLLLVIRRVEMLKLHRAALVLLLGALFIIALEIIIDLGVRGRVALGWSIYAALPVLVLALMAMGLEYHTPLKQEIRKRLFL